MKQLNLFTSNRLEILAEKLSQVLAPPLSDPLAPDIIVVQSKGMERWISMNLSRSLGICANMRFPFPNTFIYDTVFRALLPELPKQSAFDREVMAWKIMGVLPELISGPDFSDLKHYLTGDGEELKRFQLSGQIANLFDQYMTFREKWIEEWDAGKKAGWQSALWRKISQGHEKKHRVALGKRLVQMLEGSPLLAQNLPERVSVFGISSLPEFHMTVFDAISQYREVNLFLMNPCREYWGDLMSRKEQRSTVRKGQKLGMDESELYIETGNSLLSSLGSQGRDFFDLIHEYHAVAAEEFNAPGTDTLLAAIQSDILNNVERPSESGPVKAVATSDNSIAVHACHSPMREAEVLHDQLLALFDDDPALRPGDILVMMPDINTYAPYIQSVFDKPFDDPHRIPFSIADRGIRKESRVIEAFLNLLALSESRFSASQVLSVLENPAVYTRFELAEADLPHVRKWVRDVRIRWGMDAKNRSRLGLPEIKEHTWQAGLDRLFMGYAMIGREDRMVEGVLPYDAIEGGAAAVLGSLAAFTDRLFQFVKRFSRPRPLHQWSERLLAAVDGFFQSDDDTESDLQLIRETLMQMAEIKQLSGFDRPVSLRIIRAWLERHFQNDLYGFGFITGGVTFCEMLPMRSIPFRVICLLGMNSDDYPRRTPHLQFDLMAKNPRKGDRSRRNDDRYLFLETLLSAREKLYISYVGRSIRDNSMIPPSVLVSELLDVITQGFQLASGGEIIPAQIRTFHRLQAFNPSYFMDAPPSDAFFDSTEDRYSSPRLFSYSRENLKTAECLVENRSGLPPLFSRGLPPPDESWKTISLKDFCAFFGHPAKYLLNRRLNIYFEEDEEMIEDTEPFDVAGLEKYFLNQKLTDRQLIQGRLDDYYQIARTAGALPHGRVGECRYEDCCDEAETFAARIQPYISEDGPGRAEIDLPVKDFTLTGAADGVFPDHLLHYRCATIKAKDCLTAWIYHLAYNGRFGEKETVLVGTDAVWTFSPVEKPAELLEELLALYWQGLQKPLSFFPQTSLAFVEKKITQPEQAAGAARSKWLGSDFYPGECADAYFQRCTRHVDDPLDGMFEAVALKVFGPLLAHCVKT